MNLSNASIAPHADSTTDRQAGLFDPAALIPRGSVFTIFGQVRDWQLGFAGRIRCVLRSSFGDFAVNANRDTLSLDLGEGDWVRAKLMHGHDENAVMRLIGAVRHFGPVQTSWLPVASYHRYAAMAELRRLLSTLEPALQAVFLAVMLDALDQRGFFWRPAALDHHCYPGGLFDQSVAAAALAHRAAYDDERDRDLATLASLLFDIGKLDTVRLLPDRFRRWPQVQPHLATVAHLQGTLDRLSREQPRLAADLCAVLAGEGSARATYFTPRIEALRQRVRSAVDASWGPPDTFLSTPITERGAAA